MDLSPGDDLRSDSSFSGCQSNQVVAAWRKGALYAKWLVASSPCIVAFDFGHLTHLTFEWLCREGELQC